MPSAKYLICNDGSDVSAWSWTLVAPNGKEIAESKYGYNSKSACMRAVNSVRKHAKTYRIEEEC